jgi:hypothetical protein
MLEFALSTRLNLKKDPHNATLTGGRLREARKIAPDSDRHTPRKQSRIPPKAFTDPHATMKTKAREEARSSTDLPSAREQTTNQVIKHTENTTLNPNHWNSTSTLQKDQTMTELMASPTHAKPHNQTGAKRQQESASTPKTKLCSRLP